MFRRDAKALFGNYYFFFFYWSSFIEYYIIIASKYNKYFLISHRYIIFFIKKMYFRTCIIDAVTALKNNIINESIASKLK